MYATEQIYSTLGRIYINGRIYKTLDQGQIWGGSERRWSHLGSSGGPAEPPVDLGQKKFSNIITYTKNNL